MTETMHRGAVAGSIDRPIDTASKAHAKEKYPLWTPLERKNACKPREKPSRKDGKTNLSTDAASRSDVSLTSIASTALKERMWPGLWHDLFMHVGIRRD